MSIKRSLRKNFQQQLSSHHQFIPDARRYFEVMTSAGVKVKLGEIKGQRAKTKRIIYSIRGNFIDVEFARGEGRQRFRLFPTSHFNSFTAFIQAVLGVSSEKFPDYERIIR